MCYSTSYHLGCMMRDVPYFALKNVTSWMLDVGCDILYLTSSIFHQISMYLFPTGKVLTHHDVYVVGCAMCDLGSMM